MAGKPPPQDAPPKDAKVTQDRGFKAMFEAFGEDTVAFLLPGHVERHGRPSSVTLIQQEVLPQVLDEHSLFLDAALLTVWPDGHQTLILAIEHHTEARKVDPPRLAAYVANLQLRHRDCEVFPCVLVTDRSGVPVPDSHTWSAAGLEVMVLRWKLVRIGEGDLERLRDLVARTRNKLAALLIALAIRDAVEAGVATIRAMRAAGYTPAQVHRFIPLVIRIARVESRQQPRLRQRLLDEVPEMRTFLDDMVDEAIAKGTALGIEKGVAQGIAKGELAAIVHMAAKGRATVAGARAEIAELVAKGTISQAQADEALAQLPKRSVRRAGSAAVNKQPKRRRR